MVVLAWNSNNNNNIDNNNNENKTISGEQTGNFISEVKYCKKLWIQIEIKF